MKELSIKQIEEVSGGSPSFWIEQGFRSTGYGVGYAMGYFYSNVMISNNIIDDIATFVK